MVVWSGGVHECDDSLSTRSCVQMGSADLATSADINSDDDRASNRALHSVTWFQEPPVYSPVELRNLLVGAKSLLNRNDPSRRFVGEEMARRYGARECVLTESGTAALVMALRMFAPQGGTVAYPGYACIDLTAAAVRAGVKVRLYDIDPTTLSPDLNSLGRTIRRGIDAIIVAHSYGYPADVSGVRELAVKAGIPVIEDAAQAAGGLLGGLPLGALGDVSILSFGRGKGTTAGSGGALLVRDQAAADRMAHNGSRFDESSGGAYEVAALAAQWLLARPSLYGIPASIPALKLGEMVYKPAGEPRSISRSAAAMLPGALRLETVEVARRRMNAAKLVGAIKEGARLTPIHAINRADPGYLRLALLDRDGGVTARPRLGAVRGYTMTLDEHPQLQTQLLSNERAGTGSTLLRDRLFTLPTHSRVRGADFTGLIDWLNE